MVVCVGLQVGTPCVYLFCLSSRLFAFFFLFFFECVYDDAWLRGYLSGILYLFATYILMIYFMMPIWEKSTPLTVPTLISPTKLRLVL